MPTRVSFEAWFALLVASWFARKHFEQLTGMTLDEWDELNYQRVLAAGES